MHGFCRIGAKCERAKHGSKEKAKDIEDSESFKGFNVQTFNDRSSTPNAIQFGAN